MFVRKPLSYELFDLRPFIDSETMDEHYNGHYKKYTENMNKAILDDNIQIDAANPMGSLISQLKNIDEYSTEFRNNAGGYVNHMIYFENQDNPLMSINTNILLGMDVWEHAYYLKHKADRAAYLDDFFRVIDWSVVSSRL